LLPGAQYSDLAASERPCILQRKICRGSLTPEAALPGAYQLALSTERWVPMLFPAASTHPDAPGEHIAFELPADKPNIALIVLGYFE
jgi:hypothetical protein